MNHNCARQRQDGRWDYTRNGRPFGYCREYLPIPEDCGHLPVSQVKEYNAKMDLLKEKFHTTGHATEEEACECFKRYMLDTHLKLQTEEPENANQLLRCKVCNTFTACYASIGPYVLFVLCPAHQTREAVESLYKVGESWDS